MNDLSESIAQLASRVDTLEKRVHDLEQSSSALTQTAGQPSAAVLAGSQLPSGEQVSGVFLLLGKAMLGIAGAYVLRALSEWAVLPRLLIVAVAIAYAIAWLVAASRTSKTSRLGGALYSATAGLILAPLLWELTMRFGVLAPAAAAAILGVFAGAATLLSWKREHTPELSIALGAAALTALVLSVVTHFSIPFLVLLMVLMEICEYRYLRTGVQDARILVAAVADCAVWFLVVIYRNPQNNRTDYPALGPIVLIAPACVLFLVTAASLIARTVLQHRRISAFETAQSVVAFLLWAISLAFLIPRFDSRITGVLCLLCAFACYAAAWGVFRRRRELRNFHVFSIWSAGLFLAGILLCFPTSWSAPILALAAMASTVMAVRACCITLECHGVVYLTLAAFAGGLLEYSFQALAGEMPSKIAWSIFLIASCAVFCYFAAREREGEARQQQLLHLVPALFAVCATAAVAAQGTLWLLSLRFTPGLFHIAFVRSLILSAVALGLAFAGSRWRRPEMRRLAYVVLAFLAVKLLVEDLRHGHMEFIAASIFLFALALIGVPRLARVSHSAKAI